MQFVLDQSGTFNATVKFSVPGDAKRQDYEFNAIFKRLAEDEVAALNQAVDLPDPGKPGQIVTRVRTDNEICHEVMSGWSGPVDAAGVAVPFSAGALNKLLRVRGMANLIALTFLHEGLALPRKN